MDRTSILRIELDRLFIVSDCKLAFINTLVRFGKTVVSIESLRIHLDIQLEYLDSVFLFAGAQESITEIIQFGFREVVRRRFLCFEIAILGDTGRDSLFIDRLFQP